MPALIRFWFEFDSPGDSTPSISRLGCGVTAYNYDDAIHLLDRHLFKNRSGMIIKRFVENIDVSTLDPDHILSNIAQPPNLRGIWYPQL